MVLNEKGIGRFALKQAQSLFEDAAERESFLKCLAGMPDRKRAVVWPRGKVGAVGQGGPNWWPADCELVEPGIRIGELPEHGSGLVYALDPSSIFEGGILQAVGKNKTGLCIDVCASPGGKSMLAHSILKPKELVCNETIGKRIGMLKSNLERCTIEAIVKNLDPGNLANDYEDQADVVIVDAPCSGQSVLVKGLQNPGCFNPRVVESNAMRQRRILSVSAGMVKMGGWLMYSTCTYSLEENEKLIEWFLHKNRCFCEVEDKKYSFMKSRFGNGYREWPHSGFGVGGFTCLLRRDK